MGAPGAQAEAEHRCGVFPYGDGRAPRRQRRVAVERHADDASVTLGRETVDFGRAAAVEGFVGEPADDRRPVKAVRKLPLLVRNVAGHERTQNELYLVEIEVRRRAVLLDYE